MTTPDPLPAFNSSKRIKNSITLAYSTLHNPRSLEAFWYPPYTQTISDLFNFSFANDTSTLSVADRFYLGLSYQDLIRLGVIEDVDGEGGDEEDDDNVDNDGGENGSDTEHTTNVNSAVGAQGTGSSVIPANLADISFQSTATVAGGRRKDVFPDFMIAHIKVVRWAEPRNKRSPAHRRWRHRHGAHACHMCCMLIGEIKRSPSRKATGTVYNERRDNLLKTSVYQLIVYLSISFAANPDLKTLIGVCAAGPWWNWRAVEREEVPDYSIIADIPTDELHYVEEAAVLAMSFPNKPFYLGEKTSDREWERVREKLVELLTPHA